MFKEIILSNLIEPKFKKKDLDIFDYNSLKLYAQEILNASISECCGNFENNLLLNKKLYEYENRVFNLSAQTNLLLENNINYGAFVSLINDNSPINLKWLKSLANPNDKSKNFRFPIKLVLIVEGITEEILLPVFAQKCDFDFDKNGVQIVSAGGKNQVVKLYYTYAQQLKIPVFVLLDSDAKENYEQISIRKRKFDKIHLINYGEFEDILPENLVEKTLNDYLINLNSVTKDDFKYEKMVANLEEIFKNKGFHEFKKAEFAQLVKSHIDSEVDISDEIRAIIYEIKSSLSFSPQ